jgi:1-acyl-sn-glycerol-3-phosphate acyltransferase
MSTLQTAAKPFDLILLARSLLFSLGMLLSTGVGGLVMMLSVFLPFAWRYWLSQQWTRFNVWWLRVTCRIDYHLSGVEHLPDRPVVVMAKHQSTWETLFLHQLLPPVAWVVKRELLWFPLFGWGLALLRPIAIDRQSRGSAVRQVIRKGVEHLRQRAVGVDLSRRHPHRARHPQTLWSGRGGAGGAQRLSDSPGGAEFRRVLAARTLH